MAWVIYKNCSVIDSFKQRMRAFVVFLIVGNLLNLNYVQNRFSTECNLCIKYCLKSKLTNTFQFLFFEIISFEITHVSKKGPAFQIYCAVHFYLYYWTLTAWYFNNKAMQYRTRGPTRIVSCCCQIHCSFMSNTYCWAEKLKCSLLVFYLVLLCQETSPINLAKACQAYLVYVF